MVSKFKQEVTTSHLGGFVARANVFHETFRYKKGWHGSSFLFFTVAMNNVKFGEVVLCRKLLKDCTGALLLR